MRNEKKHGGRREGSGRPPKYDEPMTRTTISAPKSHVEHLRTIGKGSVSEGVRVLVEKDMS